MLVLRKLEENYRPLNILKMQKVSSSYMAFFGRMTRRISTSDGGSKLSIELKGKTKLTSNLLHIRTIQ